MIGLLPQAKMLKECAESLCQFQPFGLLRGRFGLDDRQQFGFEKIRRRRAGAYQGRKLVVLVADIFRRIFPVGRSRIIRDDPRASGIHAFGHDAKARDQIGTGEFGVADYLVDFAPQATRVETRLQDRNTPELTLERVRREADVEVLDLLGAVSERECAGDNGAGGSSADKVKMVAEANRLVLLFGENLLDALQKSHRERSAHSAAVQGKQVLWPGAKKVAIAGCLKRSGRQCHVVRSETIQVRSAKAI